MSVLILDNRDYELTIQDGLLRCFHPEKGTRMLPWHALVEIVIGHGVIIHSDALIKLAEYGIGVTVSGKRIKQQSRLYPLSAPASDFKLLQYALFSQRECTRRLGCVLLQARAKSQLKNIHKLKLPTPIEWHELTEKLNPAHPHLMLMEAQISHSYWKTLSVLLGDYGFKGRQRRPPRDPCNALFSLASTLEDSLYAKALLSQGFDIGLGFYHATGYHRQSLILDIKELTRAAIEYWVITLFLQQHITVDDFDTTANGCLLTADAKRRFYVLWFSFCQEHQKRVLRIAQLAKRYLQHEGKKVDE